MRIVLLAAMLGALALVTACREPGESRVRLVCDELCSCFTILEHDECVAECREDLEPQEISDACYECIVDSRSCFETLEICGETICDEDDNPIPEPIDAPFLDAPF